MKKLYKEFTITSGGGTIALKANDLNNYYMVTGNAVTITSGLTFTIDAAAKNNVVRLYFLQDVTIGTGGNITILSNIIPKDIIGGIMFTCVYNGSTWDIFQTAAEDYDIAVVGLSGVVYVNYDIKANDENKRVFKTYADAISYIVGVGTLTTDNHWTVMMPSGYCDEAITARAFVDIQGTIGTVLKTVVSNVTFVSSNIYDVTVADCSIKKLYVAEAKAINLVRCKVYDVAPVLGAADGQLNMSDCIILKGDFSNSESLFGWSNNKFIATEGDIELAGRTFEIKDSVLLSLTNGITLPKLLTGCSIEIPTITLDDTTVISGGYIKTTTLTGNENLTLKNLTVEGDVTIADTKELINIGSKIDGTTALLGSATKSEQFSYWNDGYASGIDSTAWNNGEATGLQSTAWNYGDATGDYSTACNNGNSVGENSFAANSGTANGVGSVSFGTSSLSEGEESFTCSSGVTDGAASYSFACNGGVAVGTTSFAANGGASTGNNSFAAGGEVDAKSFSETVFGVCNTNGAATSSTTWELSDKLFSIGNGTSNAARNDALVMLKDGKTTVDAQWNFQAGLKIGVDVTAASAANIGAMRYRSDANNSWCEMVMQTGAATYAWVVIKTNNW